VVGKPYPTTNGEGKAIGTEAFWVPAVLAAVSEGAQYANQQNATQRQNNATIAGIQNQEALQQKGSDEVKQLTNQLATSNPDQLAAKATGQYVNQLRTNAAGESQGGSGNAPGSVTFGAPTSALPTDINASSRYQQQAAGNQQQIEQFGNTLAGQMGQIDAATRQRQNEGLAMQGLGTNLNLLGAQSYTQAFVDKLRSATAGVQSPWLNLLAGAAGNEASTISKNAGGAPSSGTSIPSDALVGNGSVGGQYGLPGSTATAPAVNPWFDQTGQT